MAYEEKIEYKLEIIPLGLSSSAVVLTSSLKMM